MSRVAKNETRRDIPREGHSGLVDPRNRQPIRRSKEELYLLNGKDSR